MMVLRETPVADATADTPPRPSTFASAATINRFCRSLSNTFKAENAKPHSYW